MVMTYVCEAVSRSKLTNLQERARHRAEVVIQGKLTGRCQVGGIIRNQEVGLAMDVGRERE